MGRGIMRPGLRPSTSTQQTEPPKLSESPPKQSVITERIVPVSAPIPAEPEKPVEVPKTPLAKMLARGRGTPLLSKLAPTKPETEYKAPAQPTVAHSRGSPPATTETAVAHSRGSPPTTTETVIAHSRGSPPAPEKQELQSKLE